MKILVLATSYPRPDGYISLQYIHSRNQWYLHHGIDVSVLSFDAATEYEIDNVKVYTLNSYEKKLKNEHFDLLISHAPNLRNHFRFLKKYGELFKQIVFFFHGHEVLKTTEIYPEPYDYAKKNQLKETIVKRLYDNIKLLVWRSYFKQIAFKSHFVFVSNWMYKMFLDSVKIAPELIAGRKSIIYNCVGENFEKNRYDLQQKKIYDLITIRNSLDGSKYAIDIVTEIARSHPEFQFCVIGKGDFYTYYDKPDNLKWLDKSLRHDEIIDYLNQSSCALIPTRLDAQGVMGCEMATFGIPVITSDIDVCTEVFNGFSNVGFIHNESSENRVDILFDDLIKGVPYEKNEKYFSENTIMKEIHLFNDLIGGKG